MNNPKELRRVPGIDQVPRKFRLSSKKNKCALFSRGNAAVTAG